MMREYFDNDMLKTINLSEVEGCGTSAEEGLESIDMELLDDTGVQVTAGDIALVMLEHLIGDFVGRRELDGEEIF